MDMKYKEIQMEECMVMKMNKRGFINKLSELTKYDLDTCEKIDEIIEIYGFIGKNNKNKIENDLVEKLSFTEEEAEKIYETASSIMSAAIKDKIKHPFGKKDK